MKNRNMLLIFIGALFLCSWGFLIYSNSLHSPFQFDDQVFIAKNDSIKNIDNIKLLWRNTRYRKRIIPFASFSINYHFSKEDVFGYHFVNTIIHIFSALAVWWFSVLMVSFVRADKLKNFLFGFFVALLFLVHPIQTEAVTYISQRFTLFACLFYLLSSCFYIRARKKMVAKSPSLVIGVNFLLSFLFGFFGLLSKETVFTLPVVFLLIEVLFFPNRRKVKVVVFSGLSVFLATLGMKIFNMKWHYVFFRLADKGITSWTYLLTQFKVVVLYLGLLFFPVSQNLDYDIALSRHLWEIPTIGGFLILLMVALFGIWIYRKNKIIAFGVFWFFITLLVESSFLPINDFMVERRLYLPSVGFFIVMVEICRMLYFRWKKVVIFFCIGIVVLSFLTVRRNLVWRDPVVLWQDVIKKSPRKVRAHHNLGLVYLGQKDYVNALQCFNKVIKANPKHFLAYNNRAIILRIWKKYDQALSDYAKAVKLRPRFPQTYYNRGNVYYELGKYEKALDDYEMAIKLRHNYTKAQLALANTFKVVKNYPRAFHHYGQVLRWRPDFVDVYNNRGNLFALLGRHEEALADFQKALELNSDFSDAYNNKALVLVSLGRNQEAFVDYNKAIQLKSDYAEAYHNRGNLYYLLKDYNNALEDYNKALLINIIPQTLFARAMLYFDIGQYQLSVEDCDRVLVDFFENGEVYLLRAKAKELLGDSDGAERDQLRVQALLNEG